MMEQFFIVLLGSFIGTALAVVTILKLTEND